MLSVLIPVYNFDVRELVHELNRQCSESGKPYEIILFDDYSELKYRTKNRDLSSLEFVSITELESNVGRSVIRNRLANQAKFEHLLFLDCDSKIEHPDFIARYLQKINGRSIFFGGRSYEKNAPESPKKFLRWLYGVEREVVPATERMKNPFRSFMTNNFLIPKHFFQKVRFNESLSGYGHEDTLFGYDLKQHQLRIEHIDNPLCHIGLEDAEEFLEKTEQGVKNLAFLFKMKFLPEDVRLIASYQTLRTFYLLGAYSFIFKKLKKRLYTNLTGPSPKLSNLDLLKLGLFVEEMKK